MFWDWIKFIFDKTQWTIFSNLNTYWPFDNHRSCNVRFIKYKSDLMGLDKIIGYYSKVILNIYLLLLRHGANKIQPYKVVTTSSVYCEGRNKLVNNFCISANTMIAISHFVVSLWSSTLTQYFQFILAILTCTLHCKPITDECNWENIHFNYRFENAFLANGLIILCFRYSVYRNVRSTGLSVKYESCQKWL